VYFAARISGRQRPTWSAQSVLRAVWEGQPPSERRVGAEFPPRIAEDASIDFQGWNSSGAP
jgi:hypothetical protein